MRLALIALLLPLSPLALAQVQTDALDSAVRGGGPRSDVGEAVAVGDDGSRVVAGTFEGTATFGALSITAADGDPSRDWSDAFLVKYDADGTALWVRRGGTGIFNDFGDAVAVAPDGSVYWGGTFTALATFDGGANPDGQLQAVSDFDAFVAKYSAGGDLLWVRSVGSAEQDTGEGLAADADGVYFAGGFGGTVTVGGETLVSAGSTDAFLVRYDADGGVTWAVRGGGTESDKMYDVDLAPGGGAVAMGQFAGVAIFGAFPLQSAGRTDAFAVRYDASGAEEWAAQVGANGSEFGRGVAVAPDGSSYLTGSFENTILVGGDVLQSAGFSDAFVAKLDAAGDAVWGRRAGGSSFDFGEAVAANADGNAYAAGYVNGSGTFSTTSGTEPYATAGGNDGFLAAYDADGSLLALNLVGGTNRDDATGVAVSGAALALTGFFRETITVGGSTLTSAGSNDVFVAVGEGLGSGAALALSATASPTSLPASGGVLTISGTLTNNGDAARPVDVWVEVTGPASQTTLLASGTLAAGATASSSFNLRVPAGAPAGAYAVALNVGDFSSMSVLAFETFTVTKAASRGIAAAPLFTDAWLDANDGGFSTVQPAERAKAAADALSAFPNPLRFDATVALALAESQAGVEVAVFDVLGRRAATLHDGPLAAGQHPFRLDASAFTPGLYVVRAMGGGLRLDQRVIVLR